MFDSQKTRRGLFGLLMLAIAVSAMATLSDDGLLDSPLAVSVEQPTLEAGPTAESGSSPTVGSTASASGDQATTGGDAQTADGGQQLSLRIDVPADLDGFDPFGLEGDPRLRARVYRIILPRNVDPGSVRASVASARLESQIVERLAPVGPMYDGRERTERTDVPMSEGLNMQIYCVDADYPSSPLISQRVASFRGWKILYVTICPMLYNDARRTLKTASSVDLTVSYELLEEMTADVSAVVTQTGATYVQEMVTADGLQAWTDVTRSYDLSADSSTTSDIDYLIVTTEEIKDDQSDNGLADFIAHRESTGHNIKLVTVEHIDGYYSSGDLQWKIRKYIKRDYNAYGILYVLLVGNPDSNAQEARVNVSDPGMVPMRECLPDGESAQTDLYYAEMDNDWDTDSDGKYAESWTGTGCPDLMIGRIAPVGGYVDDIKSSGGGTLVTITPQEKLREVFEKIIRYDKEKSKSWRYKMMAVGSYMYGLDNGTAATTLQKTIEVIQNSSSSFTADTVFQNGMNWGLSSDQWFDGTSSSSNPEATYGLSGDDTLSGTSTAHVVWTTIQQYGMYFWRGHGNYQGASVGDDVDGTACDTDDGKFILRSWITNPGSSYVLTNDYPAFVSAASCSNMSTGKASYEDSDYDGQQAKWASVAQVLHWTGAIAVVAATSGTAGESPCPEDPAVGQSAWYQRRYLKLLAEGKSFGWAFIEGKQYIQGYYSSGYKTKLRDWLRINMLADPAQKLFQSTSVFSDDTADSGSGNDTQATAYHLSGTTIGLSLTVNVTGCVAKDVDWYRLDVGSLRDVTITVTRKLSMGKVMMKVFDSSGAEISHTRRTSTDDQWTWTNGSVGTGVIYIRVKPDRFITDYDLKIEAN